MQIIDLDVQVLTVTPPQVIVRWNFLPGKMRQDYLIEIQRGEREIDLRPLVTIDGDENSSYIDSSVSIINAQKFYFYTAIVTDKKTGEAHKQEITTWYGEFDPETIYVIEEQEFLHQDVTGVPAFILLEKKDGAYCGECFDRVSKKRIKSHCLTCYGTNYTGGFYTPMLKYIDFSPDVKSKVIQELGEMQPGQSQVTLPPYPLLRSGDILVEAISGERHKVKRVQTAERRRIPLLQACVVEAIPRNDICYSVPIELEKLTLAQKDLDRIKGLRGF
jgi:hypothetical protein